jgi:hypothetical protein
MLKFTHMKKYVINHHNVQKKNMSPIPEISTQLNSQN